MLKHPIYPMRTLESPEGAEPDELTQAVSDAAIEAHRALGPGLLKSAREEARA